MPTRWNYLHTTVDVDGNGKVTPRDGDIIRQLGEDGWELVGVAPLAGPSLPAAQTRLSMFFKLEMEAGRPMTTVDLEDTGQYF
jgi:hypothetical protein